VDKRPQFARLAQNSLIAVLVCVVLVTLCFYFVDRPVAHFVHHHEINQIALLWWLQAWPSLVQAWVPAVLTILALRRAFGPFYQWERALLAAAVAIVLAEQCKDSLAYCFGRYWPETWTPDKNLSLITNGEFGFHPFHKGIAYESFPSGHTARTASLAAVLWIAYPRWCWVGIVATLAVVVGLLGMNYHFVGDIIGGAFVGAWVGIYTAHFARLGPESDRPMSLMMM
jgi:membrane-associated phospholipid phosphatase